MRPFDPGGVFVDPVHSGNVRQLATHGAGATLFFGAVGLAAQLIATVVLARLLTPKDFGLVTMVTTFSLLFMNFGMNGVTEAIVQAEEINHELASNMFWITTAGSALLSVGFASAGFLLARLYHDPRITGVAEGVAVTIFLTGLQVVQAALLKRAMKFSEVSANDVLARAASVLVSVGLAWFGWGYWALVAGAVAWPVTSCIGAWFLCRWTPGMPSHVPGTGAMVRFALHTYARFTTGYFTNNLDNFLVGWRLGPVPLGFYKKAFDLFILSSNQLSNGLAMVALSALSRLQKDVAQYKQYFLSALGVMAFVGMGLSGALTLVGRDLVLVLLGPKWGESGRLFTIFAPGIGFMLLYGPHIWLHLSLGKPDRWFRWGLVDLAVTTTFLCIGLHWHAAGIAVAWVVSYWIITLPAIWYAGRPIQLEIVAVIGVIWKYLVASMAAGGTAFVIVRSVPSFASAPGSLWAVVRLFTVSLLFLILYLITVIALHRSFAPIYRVAGLLREMTARRRSDPVLGLEGKALNPTKNVFAPTEVINECLSKGERKCDAILDPKTNHPDGQGSAVIAE
jgi:PST family polysaccharide transporter